MIADTRKSVQEFIQRTKCTEDEIMSVIYEAYAYGYDDGALSGQTYSCPNKSEIKFYFFENEK